MISPDSRREPIFNVPAVISALLGIMVAIHVARQFLSEANDDWLVLALAFVPDRYLGHASHWPGGVISAWTSPVTHMFVHGDWTHLLLNGASLLAFGGIVARRLSTVRLLLFVLFAGLAGAATFFALNRSVDAPMIGASGAISGLMAATLRLMFCAIDQAPPGSAGELIRRRPDRIALTGLRSAFADPRLRSATALWLVLNVLATYGLGTPGASGPIAWEAHIGGFVAGLLGYGWFDTVNPPKPPVTAGKNSPADQLFTSN